MKVKAGEWLKLSSFEKTALLRNKTKKSSKLRLVPKLTASHYFMRN
ncbi:hypothetical protein [Rossellomorea vietnamensis]|nr:hypothetical protein [Rossellomorea vietnamensis]